MITDDHYIYLFEHFQIKEFTCFSTEVIYCGFIAALIFSANIFDIAALLRKLSLSYSTNHKQ